MLKSNQDGFGQEIYDFYRGERVAEIVERDDGFIDVSGGPPIYFAEYKNWRPHEKKAIKLARGKVLDIGCGAGRVCLYLQGKGFDVTGIDYSPLAIKVCKLRGVQKARVLPITMVSSKLGRFDTITMFGNNFGLFGSYSRAKWLLGRFKSITNPGSIIIAESSDPYATDKPHHLAYHLHNRRRGRMSGQIRLRIRHKTYRTPWFDYLIVSREEMEKILYGTGWKILRYIDSGPMYMAVIERIK